MAPSNSNGLRRSMIRKRSRSVSAPGVRFSAAAVSAASRNAYVAEIDGGRAGMTKA